MYDLHQLGWKSFQDLCHTIVREILSQTVEPFLDSHDGGRDGAFAGTWSTEGQEDLSGRLVVQCKFTSKRDRNLRLSDITEEINKAERLAERGLCDSYILITNYGVSGEVDSKIKSALCTAGIARSRIFGSSWINAQIRENSRLRMRVPRLYGLGDLSQILDERAYAQSRAVLDSMRDDLAKVVITNAYKRAVDAIQEHGFVLIIGEPASGKTTIASLLAMAALDEWKLSLLKLNSPQAFSERWNPNEPTQLFWIDDAFGMTQHEDALVREWNRTLTQIPAMLKGGARVVMTSRDYIYHRARNELKHNTFPLLHESQVVIDVQELDLEEKRRMLYNHIKLGRQPQAFRTKIKPYLERAANRPRFIPEVARRIADPYYTANMTISAPGVVEFVDKPEELLRDTIQRLDTDSKSALGLIFMRNGHLRSPIDLRDSEQRALQRLGGTLAGCLEALSALEGSFVRLSHTAGEPVWEFQHPTIGDGYASLMAQNPEHVEILVEGISAERLVSQATCGNMGVKGAIVIPRPLFPLVREKLQHANEPPALRSHVVRDTLSTSSIDAFLARRCCDEFLSMYIEHEPLLVERVSRPGLFLSAGFEADLASRLHVAGLLPEHNRRTFVETVREHVLENTDASVFADEAIKAMFTGEEFEALEQEVRQQVLPSLSDICSDWLWYSDAGQEPEDAVYPLIEFLEALKGHFAEEANVVRDIDVEISSAWDWVADQEAEHEDSEEVGGRELVSEVIPRSSHTERSIFDDIDAEE